MSSRFAPLDPGGLRKRYGDFFRQNAPITTGRIPAGLEPLRVYAELWGLTDDGEREDLVERAPTIALDDLVAIFTDPAVYKSVLNWLGAPGSPDYLTDAYRSFGAMMEAYDSVRSLRERKHGNDDE